MMTSHEMRSPNVSVTPIKMEQYSPPGGATTTLTAVHALRLSTANGGGEGVEAIVESTSDAEVAQIEFESSMVNLRQNKKKKKKERGDELQPRPMSWEGELSDGGGGGDRMCVDEDDDDDNDHRCYDDVVVVPENLSLTRANNNNNNNKEEEMIVVGLASTRPKTQRCVNYSLHSTPNNSPLLNQRHHGSVPLLASHQKELMQKALQVPPTPSPDSAVHSAYSVFSSPSQSPLTQRHLTTPNLSRNNSDASYSSCCSYSSVSVSLSPTQQFGSPTHSPVQGRHCRSNAASTSSSSSSSQQQHHNLVYNRNVQQEDVVDEEQQQQQLQQLQIQQHQQQQQQEDNKIGLATHNNASLTAAQPGISRQQLINSPCPICGDKISGFHYGIFSCESCKGFFKRTVQNRKNYVCLRGASCPVTVTTRKKCPACRFDKCLQCGMKLEAIREDRTRGGRSTYQCSYSLPPSLFGHGTSNDLRQSGSGGGYGGEVAAAPTPPPQPPHHLFRVKLEPGEQANVANRSTPPMSSASSSSSSCRLTVPPLLQEIMDVEHLWHYSDVELTKINGNDGVFCREGRRDGSGGSVSNISSHPLLAGTALAGSTDTNPDFVANLCSIADHRLYKIVKWCKSLPLFKNISIDDQISLLINSWCELLLFSCCFRSISTPGEIRISVGKNITLEKAKEMGLGACIERMLNFTDHLRRLRVDKYEYVAMKVIVLLTSDMSELREAEKVRASQEKALQALQHYTLAHYPDTPLKFGELLLRIPELQRTCQIGKEMLTIKSKDGEGPNFNLLLELLRGDH